MSGFVVVLRCSCLLALAATLAPALAEDALPQPNPSQVRALQATPVEVVLRGGDAARQLVITATLDDGRQQDLTRVAAYEVSDPTVVSVSGSGRVTPRGNGSTAITVHYGDHRAEIPVRAEAVGENLPISFANQVLPVFTKLGCNSGGCHGKQSGQNGFRLSLLGFDPDLDYETLVHEGRGRRVFPAAPDASLVLQKGAGIVPHGGGKKMEVDSDEYRVLRRWIALGLPKGGADDPMITEVTVVPDRRSTTRDNVQQLAVLARYSDGTVEDVTRRAQYESNDQEVATVDEEGLVRTLNLSGEAAVMVRYQGKVTVSRVTVPLGGATPAFEFPIQTLVDQHTQRKWRELGLVPSEPANDAQFLRRVSLDLTGTLPTPERLRAFLADADPDKRAKLVDELLNSQDYAYFFANKWADVLRVQRGREGNANDRAQGTFAFHAWIRQAMAEDRPFDQFVRDILSAVGDETTSPPAYWYRELQTADQLVDDTAQVFLGVRINCAQCHHHPYEKWSQDDYWGLAAYFGRLARRNVMVPGADPQAGIRQRQILTIRSNGTVTNKRTGKPAQPRPLDGEPSQVEPGDDPRQKLADWMTDPQNPFFARALVNRYWAHFLGRGIVDPPDDMRVTNPPSNPELLDALADDFTRHGHSLKHLIRVICNSRTYQLDSTPNEFNQHDKQSFARYHPKRLTAEVVYDAVNQVLAAPAQFNNLPGDRFAPRRAIMLPDESYQSYFLDVFGRPQRISACECERVREANLAQVLHLLNSNELQSKLSRGDGRADAMAKDPRPDTDKVRELFLWALSREPGDSQLQAALAHLAQNEKTKKAAYENILWSLINTKEFVFNR
jgi:hypothetical protein